MNEKIKSFFIGFGACLVAVVSFVCGLFIHNNRSTNDGIKSDTDRLSDTTDKLSGTTDKLSDNNSRLADLIGEIEKTKSEN